MGTLVVFTNTRILEPWILIGNSGESEIVEKILGLQKMSCWSLQYSKVQKSG